MDRDLQNAGRINRFVGARFRGFAGAPARKLDNRLHVTLASG
jgi:hypothetical protein